MIASTYAATTPTAPSHSIAVASGRKPMRNATPSTTAVVTRFFTTLATTCPTSTVPLAIGIDRKRSMMPPDMSCSTAIAVFDAP